MKRNIYIKLIFIIVIFFYSCNNIETIKYSKLKCENKICYKNKKLFTGKAVKITKEVDCNTEDNYYKNGKLIKILGFYKNGKKCFEKYYINNKVTTKIWNQKGEKWFDNISDIK